MKLIATEHQIQTQIMNYLRAKGWYVMRLNTGKYSVGEGRQKRFILGQEKGTPDLMAFKKGWINAFPTPVNVDTIDLVFVEVKRPGNKTTMAQDFKMAELEEYGARCVVATSIDDLEKVGI